MATGSSSIDDVVTVAHTTPVIRVSDSDSAPASHNSGSESVKAGLLSKRHVLPGYPSRNSYVYYWVEASADEIRYWKSEADRLSGQIAHRRIPVDPGTVEILPSLGPGAFLFSVKYPGQQEDADVFSATSFEERQEWINSLTSSRLPCGDSGGRSASTDEPTCRFQAEIAAAKSRIAQLEFDLASARFAAATTASAATKPDSDAELAVNGVCFADMTGSGPTALAGGADSSLVPPAPPSGAALENILRHRMQAVVHGRLPSPGDLASTGTAPASEPAVSGIKLDTVDVESDSERQLSEFGFSGSANLHDSERQVRWAVLFKLRYVMCASGLCFTASDSGWLLVISYHRVRLRRGTPICAVPTDRLLG